MCENMEICGWVTVTVEIAINLQGINESTEEQYLFIKIIFCQKIINYVVHSKFLTVFCFLQNDLCLTSA